jgi:hypothetical protein
MKILEVIGKTGLTITEFCRQAGLTRRTVYNWINDDRVSELGEFKIRAKWPHLF